MPWSPSPRWPPSRRWWAGKGSRIAWPCDWNSGRRWPQENFSNKVLKSIQERCRVRADIVEFVPTGTIPEADKRVKDTRTWE